MYIKTGRRKCALQVGCLLALPRGLHLGLFHRPAAEELFLQNSPLNKNKTIFKRPCSVLLLTLYGCTVCMAVNWTRRVQYHIGSSYCANCDSLTSEGGKMPRGVTRPHMIRASWPGGAGGDRIKPQDRLKSVSFSSHEVRVPIASIVLT
jgi:hypothetical protein